MSNDRPIRDTLSLEEATDFNLWELAAMAVRNARTGSKDGISEMRQRMEEGAMHYGWIRTANKTWRL